MWPRGTIPRVHIVHSAIMAKNTLNIVRLDCKPLVSPVGDHNLSLHAV